MHMTELRNNNIELNSFSSLPYLAHIECDVIRGFDSIKVHGFYDFWPIILK